MSKAIYSNIDEKQLRQWYEIELLNGGEIRKRLGGISQTTFLRALKHIGIKPRGQITNNPKLRDREWLEHQYITLKKSTRDIAEEIGSTRGAVYSILRSLKIATRSNIESLDIKYPNGRWGQDASNWRGGRRRAGTKGTYIAVYAPDHPSSDKGGYVLEHRLVVEKDIGRYLRREEQVHHINGDKKDNRIENLELMESAAAHAKRHTDERLELNRLRKLLESHNISY